MPLINQAFVDHNVLCGLGETCMRRKGHQIHVNWNGMKTLMNSTVLKLNGKGFECRAGAVIAGIEIQKLEGCRVRYRQCEFENSGGDGCQMRCPLQGDQIGRPFNVMLVIEANDETELCDINMQLNWPMVTPAHKVIGDWNAFTAAIATI